MKASTIAVIGAAAIGSADPAQADAALDAALYDIGRAESQAASLNPGRKAAITRVARMVEDARNRLSGSADQGSDDWNAAMARVEALDAALATLTAPQPAPAPATTAPAATAQPQTAPAAPSVPAADIAALASLDRRSQNAWAQLQVLEVGDWMRPHLVENWHTQIAGLESMAASLAHVPGPEADTVRGNVAFLRQYVDTAVGLAQTQAVDAEADLAAFREIEAWVHAARLPDVPWQMEEAHIAGFLDGLDAFRVELRAQRVRLAEIDATHPDLSQSMIDGLGHRLGAAKDTDIERAVGQLVTNMVGEVDKVGWRIDQIMDADPMDRSHRLNRILGDDGEANRAAFLAAQVMLTRLGDVERRLGLPPVNRRDLAERLQTALDTLDEKQALAVADVSFPRVRVTDPDLLEHAREALANAGFDPQAAERMEITSEITQHNQTEGYVDVGAATIDVTVSAYEWDEFAVTTVEPTENGFRLYYHLFKFYHKGGSDVPVGRVVLAERRASSPILAENIHG